MEWSQYRRVWVVVMFDLPTVTAAEKARYRAFRSSLLNDGFTMMQYSVYIRHCPSEENAEVHFRRIKEAVPVEGQVRILYITDKQFARMKIFFGKIEREPEGAPEQLLLF